MATLRNGKLPLVKLGDGRAYEGEWLNGNLHGRGIFTSADGNRYDGEWRDDKKHGRGINTSADGDRYDGE